MPFIELNGIEIHYDTSGSGPALILIPGWGGSGESWRSEMINLLASRFTVITYDPRGTGQSDKPNEPYTTKRFADDVVELLKQLHLTSAHILGFSMGGSIAQVVALEHPEIVQSLILCSTSALGGPRFPMDPQNAKKFASIRNPPPGSPLDYGARVIIELLYPPEYVKAHRDELIREEYYSEHPTPKETLNHMSALGETYNAYEKLHLIRIPTLILAGGADVMVSLENSQVIASRIPGARLRIFPGAGHGLLKQMTKEAVAEILAFLP